MTPRTTDCQKRRDTVLGIVVGEYIKTVSPVSSKYIAKAYSLDLSSATIRNILADLEHRGFLTHPHTSAGRIPTQFGYRYYVDHLMSEIHLLEEEKSRIQNEYNREAEQLEFLLDRTSLVISDVTNYTTIITNDDWNDRIICHGTSFIVEYPEQQDLKKIRNILETLEEKKRILNIINRDLDKKIEIFIGNELQCSEIESCSMAVSKFENRRGSTGRIAVLGPTRMDYNKVVSTLNYVTELLENF